MHRKLIPLVTALVAVLLPAALPAQPGYRFEKLGEPSIQGDPQGYTVWGMTNDDTLVGWFGPVSGTLSRAGVLTPILAPSSLWTACFGITDGGAIVGVYGAADGSFQNFVRTPDGAFTSYAYPGATYTSLDAIADSGLILGSWFKETTYGSFLLWPDGTATDLSFSGYYGPAGLSWRAVNNAATLAGGYVDDQWGWHTVVAHGSRVTEIVIPGAMGSYPVAINNRGEVAGAYWTADIVYHGFVADSAGRATPVDYPLPWPDTAAFTAWGQTYTGTLMFSGGTIAEAMNDRGQVVGTTVAAYLWGGYPLIVSQRFIATPANPDQH